MRLQLRPKVYHNMLWAREKKADASFSITRSVLTVEAKIMYMWRGFHSISILLIYKMRTLVLTLQDVGRITDSMCERPALCWAHNQKNLEHGRRSCFWLSGQCPLFRDRYSLPQSQLRLRTWVSSISGCKGPTLAWNRDGPSLLISAILQVSSRQSYSCPSLHVPLRQGPK